MIFQLMGLTALLLFYGVYFGKMAAQRKQGIQTDHIAKGGKKGRLFRVEMTMKAATYAVPVVEIISLLSGTSRMPDLIRYLGALAAFAGAACFAASVYTMRDSWRAGIPEGDKTEIVTTGIYSMSRNPAFLGFDLVYIGLLLMFFNPVLPVLHCAINCDKTPAIYARAAPAKLVVGSTTPSLCRHASDADIRHFIHN